MSSREKTTMNEENKQTETLPEVEKTTTLGHADEADEKTAMVIQKAKPKWLIPAIAGIGVIVLVGAGLGGYHVWTSHELAVAKEACATAAEKVRESASDYNTLVNGDASDASAITADQVKDTKTVESLAEELKNTAPEYAGCVADDAKGLNAAADALESQAKWYETHTKSLSKAVKNVTESKAAKTLETAKSNLSSKLDEASKLLSDSDGKVADNATRDNLTKAIDDGNKLKDGTDLAKIDSARKAIEDAMKTVNDSINAKNEADAQAAAAAAQASSGSGYTGSSSRGGSNYSGGTTYGKNANGSSGSQTSNGNSGSTGGQKTQNGWTLNSDGSFSATFCGTLGQNPTFC